MTKFTVWCEYDLGIEDKEYNSFEEAQNAAKEAVKALGKYDFNELCHEGFLDIREVLDEYNTDGFLDV